MKFACLCITITAMAGFWGRPAMGLNFDVKLYNTGATFVLEGVIEPGDTKRFKAYFDSKADGFGFSVALNSPGGNMIEGIKLGEYFRETAIKTFVARYPKQPFGMEDYDYSNLDSVAGAQCSSACALAFLGGVEQTVADGGIIGFHQFSGGGDERSAAETMASTQTVSAIVASYLREMGAAPGLFEMMSATPPEALYTPAAADLVFLGITTSPSFHSFRLIPKDGEVVATATNARNLSSVLERVYEVETFCWKGRPMVNFYAENSSRGLPQQMADPTTTHFDGFWLETVFGQRSFGNDSVRFYPKQRLLATLMIDSQTARGLGSGNAKISVNSYTASGVFMSVQIDGGAKGDEAIFVSFKDCLQ